MAKLFDSLGMEDHSNIDGASALEISAIITAEEVEVEVQEAFEEINTTIVAMDTGIEAAASLESQIALGNSVLAAGDIAPSTAKYALEAYSATAGILGLDASDLNVSEESLEASPATALRVTVESAKEVFDKIVAKIKSFFAKVGAALKKLGAKIIMMVANFEKRFKALDDSVGNHKDETIDSFKEYSEKEIGKMQKAFYISVIKNSGFVKGIVTFSKVINKTEAAKAVAESAKVAVGTQAAKSMSLAKRAGEAQKQFIVFAGYDGFGGSFDKADKSINKTFIASRTDGIMLRGIQFEGIDAVLPGGSEFPYLKATYVTGSVRKDSLKASAKEKIETISLSEVKDLINAGIDLSKTTKEHVDACDKVQKSTDDMIKGLEVNAEGDKKDQDEDKMKSILGSVATGYSSAVARYGSDYLMGYVMHMKNILFIANLALSKYKKA